MFDSSHTLISSGIGNEVNTLINSSERRNIYSLSLNNTTTSNSSGVFSWAAVAYSITKDLDWVFSSMMVNNIQSLFDDSHSLKLFTCISSVISDGTHQSLNKWHRGLSKSLYLISSSSVWNKNSLFSSMD